MQTLYRIPPENTREEVKHSQRLYYGVKGSTVQEGLGVNSQVGAVRGAPAAPSCLPTCGND